MKMIKIRITSAFEDEEEAKIAIGGIKGALDGTGHSRWVSGRFKFEIELPPKEKEWVEV